MELLAKSAVDLDHALRELGWPGAYLAGRLGVHPQAVSAWRRGRRNVPGYVLEYLRVCLLAREVLATEPVQSSTYRYRDTEKRRAYMREFMRRKRADA